MTGLLRPAGIVTQLFGPTAVSAEPAGWAQAEAGAWMRALGSKFPGGTYGVDVHRGVDMRTKADASHPDWPKYGIGLPLVAAEAGRVIARGTDGYGGRYIGVQIRPGVSYWYWHLSSWSVGLGAMVSRGQVVGLSGDSGLSQGAHLHFELRVDEILADGVVRTMRLNPMRFLQGGDHAADPRILPIGGVQPAPTWTFDRLERLPEGTRFVATKAVNVWDPNRPGAPVGQLAAGESALATWRLGVTWSDLSHTLPNGYPFDQLLEPAWLNCLVVEADGVLTSPAPPPPPEPEPAPPPPSPARARSPSAGGTAGS